MKNKIIDFVNDDILNKELDEFLIDLRSEIFLAAKEGRQPKTLRRKYLGLDRSGEGEFVCDFIHGFTTKEILKKHKISGWE